jgi:hypothetical protein
MKGNITMNRFAGFGDNGGVPEARTDKPKKYTKPKVRNARNVGIDDGGFIPNAKRGMTMVDYDISRGPYHAILDKMARARQAIAGESYAKAFTEVYTDPKNAAIRDGSKYDDLAKAFDSVHGTSKSLVKAAAPPDAVQDDVSPGSAHAELNERVVAHMKANPTLSYQQAFTREYLHPDNRPLKERVDAESILHAQARESGEAISGLYGTWASMNLLRRGERNARVFS